jgi:SAM-dependent methyltransferase
LSELNDPARVREEYASEGGLLGRRAAYEFATGPDAREGLFAAIAEAEPARVLEVGCGPGELAARIQAELGATVVAIDVSERMVALARDRGVDARVGDVQRLPFDDASFDCTIAAWMLYHVPDVRRGLAELSRVLEPGGRLVAVTNGVAHMQELRVLVGLPGATETAFTAENAEALLREHFDRVERREASGTVRFPDRAAVVSYVRASFTLYRGADVPDDVPEPFVVSRRPVVFVADK